MHEINNLRKISVVKDNKHVMDSRVEVDGSVDNIEHIDSIDDSFDKRNVNDVHELRAPLTNSNYDNWTQ